MMLSASIFLTSIVVFAFIALIVAVFKNSFISEDNKIWDVVSGIAILDIFVMLLSALAWIWAI